MHVVSTESTAFDPLMHVERVIIGSVDGGPRLIVWHDSPPEPLSHALLQAADRDAPVSSIKEMYFVIAAVLDRDVRLSWLSSQAANPLFPEYGVVAEFHYEEVKG